MKPTSAIVPMLLLLVLAGCEQPAQSVETSTPSPQVTTTPDPMEIIELKELDSYTQAAAKGDTSVAWTSVTSSPQPAGSDEAGKLVQNAIKSEAERLAHVDYAALSLPAFTTVTGSLNLAPQDFTGNELRLDSTGESSGEKRWALYSWRGPDVPPLPDRPLVSRWVQVYALYDLKESKVVRLIATVRGEAHE